MPCNAFFTSWMMPADNRPTSANVLMSSSLRRGFFGSCRTHFTPRAAVLAAEEQAGTSGYASLKKEKEHGLQEIHPLKQERTNTDLIGRMSRPCAKLRQIGQPCCLFQGSFQQVIREERGGSSPLSEMNIAELLVRHAAPERRDNSVQRA